MEGIRRYRRRAATRWFAGSLALLLLLALGGCGHLFSRYDVAPDGLQRAEHEFRRRLAGGHADSALLQLSSSKRKYQLPEDELLRLLFEGVAAHYAGDYTRSASAFDRASLIAEDRSTKSVSKAALSVVVSDWSLEYEPSRTERLLLPYYAALSYLKSGKPQDAAVEARRLVALLQLENAQGARDAQLDAFLHYFSAVIFEAAGERNDAEVAYRNAFALDSTLQKLGAGNVVLLVEHGFVPHRVQESVFVNLGGYEARALRHGRSDDERRSVLAQIGARVLQYAGSAGPRTGSPRGRTLWVPAAETKASTSHESCDSSCDDDDDDGYLLRMSWPVMFDESPAAWSPTLVIDSAAVTATTTAVDDAILDDFHREQPAIIARTIARAAAKYALSRSADKSAGKDHETLGDVLGVITNIAGAVTEQADTRSWHVLPGSISLVRLQLAPGVHRLRAGARDLSPIDVAPEGISIISRRAWN